jgi:NAD(P)-dependent dehydrogenase (short-subunit alcohol dehydrogenase family)
VAHTGGTGADTTVLETSIETWDQSFAVNVRSYFIATKYALPHMLKNGSGSIVNIASDSGLGGDCALVAYGSSKAAVVNFSRYVAAQYGRQGIRCNTICPGPIATQALREHAPETLKSTLNAVYVPQLGEPQHIAALVAYFSSDEAAYTNGAMISCDGGLDAVITPWMAQGKLMN